LAYSLNLKMEVTCSFEVLVDFQQTTWHLSKKIELFNSHFAQQFSECFLEQIRVTFAVIHSDNVLSPVTLFRQHHLWRKRTLVRLLLNSFTDLHRLPLSVSSELTLSQSLSIIAFVSWFTSCILIFLGNGPVACRRRWQRIIYL
jgi:hypothetical protein